MDEPKYGTIVNWNVMKGPNKICPVVKQIMRSVLSYLTLAYNLIYSTIIKQKNLFREYKLFQVWQSKAILRLLQILRLKRIQTDITVIKTCCSIGFQIIDMNIFKTWKCTLKCCVWFQFSNCQLLVSLSYTF